MDFYDILLAKKLSGGGGGEATLIDKNISSNGTYNASSDSADGYKKVVVSVPNTYVAGDEGKVVSNGALVSQSSATYDSNGTYDTTLKNSVTVNVPPYEQDYSGLKPVAFVDYDGTLLHNYTVEEFLALDSMPSNPSHTGLTAQGWNWSLQNAKDFVSTYGCVCIGQNYITSDGLTKLYLSFDSFISKKMTRLQIQVQSGTVTVDWGDGSATETTSGTGLKKLTHSYVAGDYILTLKSNSASYYLGYNGANHGILYDGDNSASMISAEALRKMEIGEGVTCIARQCFIQCNELKSISIPTTVTSISSGTSDQAFTDATNLDCIVIPTGCSVKGNTSYTGLNFSMHHKFISFPDTNVSNIGISGATNANYGCELIMFTAKTNVSMGNGINGGRDMKYFAFGGTPTVLPGNYCRNTHLVEKVVVPSTVTSITDYAMNQMYGVIVMLPETPPTLAHTRAVSSSSKIYVPYSEDHSILEAYQTASNWSSYADKIEEMPQ